MKFITKGLLLKSIYADAFTGSSIGYGFGYVSEVVFWFGLLSSFASVVKYSKD